ncbi:MAG TPA: hypothetical protein VFF90_05465 [Saprospiraceae bacterium]|nr:hypothetical protein [Saprospiraceae bacterium]
MSTTKKMLNGILFLAMTTMLLSFDEPKGWFKAGSLPKSYDMGIDKGAAQDGKNAATIKSLEENIEGFGTLMQNCLADHYAGKRVRMSGMMRTKDVSDWAGFWFRIDKKGSTETLGFDNMHDGKKDRSVKGTTAWTKYEIVLDVPLHATNLAYGALLSGTGQIWFDHLKFEVVDNSVPTTGSSMESMMPNTVPVNLDFEE